MMSEKWLFNVLEATSSEDKVLDVLAKTDDARSELKIYVVNTTNEPREAVINVEGFRFRTSAETWTLGDCDLTEFNTVDNKTNVAPKLGKATIKRSNAKYTFPRYSYTVITLKK